MTSRAATVVKREEEEFVKSSRKHGCDGDVGRGRKKMRTSTSAELDTHSWCHSLPKVRTVFSSFLAACRHYNFPGSHQVGSYGPKGQGIVRTYSNATPGKDKLLDGGQVMLYRLKDEKVRAQFVVNMKHSRHVRVFQKVKNGAMDLGLFQVAGFVRAGAGDRIAEFGPEFVRYERVDD